MHELVYHDLEIEKFFLVDGVIVYHTLLPEIVDWIVDKDMSIDTDILTMHTATSIISKNNTSGKFISSYFPKRHRIKKLILRFDTEEDRNLFKLTWG